MSAITNNNIAQAIYLASKDKTHAEQSLVFQKVIQFLFKKRLLSKSGDILVCLNKIINDNEGKIIAKVFSPEKISEAIKKELTHNLSKRYFGKTIILEENLNKELLGGIRIEVNDEVIDFSIKNRIKKLQEYLTKSA